MSDIRERMTERVMKRHNFLSRPYSIPHPSFTPASFVFCATGSTTVSTVTGTKTSLQLKIKLHVATHYLYNIAQLLFLSFSLPISWAQQFLSVPIQSMHHGSVTTNRNLLNFISVFEFFWSVVRIRMSMWVGFCFVLAPDQCSPASASLSCNYTAVCDIWVFKRLNAVSLLSQGRDIRRVNHHCKRSLAVFWCLTTAFFVSSCFSSYLLWL